MVLFDGVIHFLKSGQCRMVEGVIGFCLGIFSDLFKGHAPAKFFYGGLAAPMWSLMTRFK